MHLVYIGKAYIVTVVVISQINDKTSMKGLVLAPFILVFLGKSL